MKLNPLLFKYPNMIFIGYAFGRCTATLKKDKNYKVRACYAFSPHGQEYFLDN